MNQIIAILFVIFLRNFHIFSKDFTICRERGREGRKRERETSMCGCLSHVPYWGLGLKPRHVPWLGIQPVTLWFTGQCSIHWATLSRAIIVFHSDCINLHSYEQYTKVPLFLQPCSHLPFVFLQVAILTGVRCYLIVILIWIFLAISDEYLFIYLLAICVSLEKFYSSPQPMF